MDGLTKEWLEKSLKKYENKPTDSHRWGVVQSVEEDGSYMVSIGEGDPALCSPACSAEEGDVVWVCVTKDGKCVAVSRLGGELSEVGVSAADYVESRGETDGWSWEKWNSGKAVCWKGEAIFPEAWNAWGGIYEGSPGLGSQSYPFAFKEPPAFRCDLVSIIGDQLYIAGFEIGPQNSNVECPSVNVLRGSSADTFPVFEVRLTAEGRWK